MPIISKAVFSPASLAFIFNTRRYVMKTLLLLAVALAFPVVAGAADKDDLNDAKIAHIVVTANQVDIEAGNLAKKKASSEDVQGYGHRMVGEHTDVNKEASDLVAKLGVTP